MTAKQLTYQRLPMVLAMSVLSAGLLLSGCSNNDNAETPVATDDSAVIVDTQDSETTDQTTVVSADATNENEAESVAVTAADNIEDKMGNNAEAPDTAADSDAINPAEAADEQPSLVTNPTQTGTAEDTVKLALDTLYYGDAKKAATYYKVDMANFTDELTKTQPTFQQTVEGVTLTNTKYNSDKTRATVTGELMLKDQNESAPLTYELQKINGEWKILG